jgi:hypothetical protein
MSNQMATHEDAQLILKLYELRRDEKMREARDWYLRKFFPQTMDDVRAYSSLAVTENTYMRMVTSYWDMAASFVVLGAVNPELFMESSQEMIMVWAKLEPFIAQIREESRAPFYLSNVEQAIKMVPAAAERLEYMRRIMPRMREMAEPQEPAQK